MKINLSYDDSNVLRGLAILAVVLLHVLAFLHGIYTLSPYRLIFITVDQLGRFCVPLFILLSGYGLTKKYQTESLNLGRYLKSRFMKLLPLYLLWSLMSHVLFLFIPQWSFANQPKSLVIQLLLGQADYQLYFLPVIFQFYLLFPFLLIFLKRLPFMVLMVGLVVQFLFYGWVANWWSFAPLPQLISTDQTQYMLFLTWIGYFVIGMWLARSTFVPKPTKWLPLLTLVGVFTVIYTATQDIRAQIDPIIALRFTRWPVMLYAIPMSLMLIVARLNSHHIKTGRTLLKKILVIAGKESYIIFLAHTIGLRIFFAALSHQLTPTILISVTVIWLITILISRKIS